MRPEDLQLNLRPRSSWEAMELGLALLRRHAGAVWRAWLPLVLLAALACHGLGLWLQRPWLGLLLLWWCKPALEQAPLYVLSRAVFGQVPGVRASLGALPGFGWRWWPAYLGWRRLGPARALLAPVDLLEGNQGPQRRLRRRAVAGPAYLQAAVLTLACLLFELVLACSLPALALLFVPAERMYAQVLQFLGGFAEGAAWVWPLLLASSLLGLALVGPFYVTAGLGLYLNRRSESEAWDVELAFRRLRERLLARMLPVLLAALAGMVALPLARTAEAAPPQQGQANTLEEVFAAELADDASFRKAAAEAYQDPQLGGGARTVKRWRPKSRSGSEAPLLVELMARMGQVLAVLGEGLLWVLLAAAVLALVLTARRWLPWLRGGGRRARAAAETEARVDALELPETLPGDIPAAARRLWQQGRPRAALALLYRASVEEVAGHSGQALPAGATEAQCLRAARALPEAPRQAFAAMVRVWQYAAYAGRLPDQAGFEALLAGSARAWGWRA